MRVVGECDTTGRPVGGRRCPSGGGRLSAGTTLSQFRDEDGLDRSEGVVSMLWDLGTWYENAEGTSCFDALFGFRAAG